MPDHIRFLGLNCLIGIAASWVVLAMFLLVDLGGLATLIANSSEPVVPVVTLVVCFAITFGSAAMGVGIMSLGNEDDGPGRGLRERVRRLASRFAPGPSGRRIPIAVEADVRRR